MVFFATGEQARALRFFAGRAGHDFDAALQDVVGIFENEVRLAAPKSRRNISWNSARIAAKLSAKRPGGVFVDFADQFLKLPLGVDRTVGLAGRRAGLRVVSVRVSRRDLHFPGGRFFP